MKLLRDFFRQQLAGNRADTARGDAVPARASAPAPRVGSAVVVETPSPVSHSVESAAAVVRREPASFLKRPRRRRLGSAGR